jgi:hypothetical protein
VKRLLVLVSVSALLLSSRLAGQNNWTSFGQDPGGTQFSTLAQIDTSNVKDLKRAWTFHTGDKSGFFESSSTRQPIRFRRPTSGGMPGNTSSFPRAEGIPEESDGRHPGRVFIA